MLSRFQCTSAQRPACTCYTPDSLKVKLDHRMYFLLALSLVFASSSVVHCNDGDTLTADAVNVVCKLTTGLKASAGRYEAIQSEADAKIAPIRLQVLKARLYKILANKTGGAEQLADIYARAARNCKQKPRKLEQGLRQQQQKQRPRQHSRPVAWTKR
ncbi:Trypanosome variant surface glycoprotein (A-type), putative [Trypanosoma equiperdum]|uniref:Trypanosome variant surface glycoprotein (A-type), putative n=1 Tax=Trypanosoma equiperdum TaxID=5694 RepID=A0A1G4I7P9_TRYEQ|nr:Trypanosome variant surface glycoprotein (A-type), putative [Trypanosoma equiperdum]